MIDLNKEIQKVFNNFNGEDTSVFNDVLEQLYDTKKEAIFKEKEKLANDCWRLISAIKLNSKYVEVFYKIKEEDYLDAWKELEQCEIASNSLVKNCDKKFLKIYRIGFIQKHVQYWQSLFPYKVFFSPGYLIEYHSCSICGHKIRPRSRCEHDAGKLYMGEICSHKINGMKLLEVSMVTNPVQKYSVVTTDEIKYNYSLVNSVSLKLNNAFHAWKPEWSTKKYPRKYFSSIDGADQCPCDSGLKFEECCSDKSEIIVPHLNIYLSEEVVGKLTQNQ